MDSAFLTIHVPFEMSKNNFGNNDNKGFNYKSEMKNKDPKENKWSKASIYLKSGNKKRRFIMKKEEKYSSISRLSLNGFF